MRMLCLVFLTNRFYEMARKMHFSLEFFTYRIPLDSFYHYVNYKTYLYANNYKIQ